MKIEVDFKYQSKEIPIEIMTAVSSKQQRYMGMCAHAKNPPDKCPSKKVAKEMSRKPEGGYKKRDKRDVKFY